MKEYFILDHTTKTFDVKEELKAKGAKWSADHKAWCILSPSEEMKSFIKGLGCKLQFRRDVNEKL